jgi:beta-lactamase superfamily II metal-dependent hydrolase
VLERYRTAGVQILCTDLDGAVSVVLSDSKVEITSERRRRGRYWLQ